MTDLRTRIFDLIYEQGPQTTQYLAVELGVDRKEVRDAVQDDPWFFMERYRVHIAIAQPKHPMVK